MKKIFLLFAMLILPALATDIPYGNNGYNSTTCNSGVLQNDSGTVRLRARYEPNQISINWYSGDTELNSTSCNYGGDLNILSASSVPTRPGYTFKGWKVTKVPGGYTELEYIQSNGTEAQYIDTGIPGNNNNYKFVVDFKVTNLSSSYIIFGNGIKGIGDNYNVWRLLIYDEHGYTLFYTNTKSYNPRVTFSNSLRISDNQRYLISMDYNNATANGTEYNYNSYYLGTTNNTTIKLFHEGQVSTKVSIYSCVVYDNDVLILDLIPARRDSDNVVGMFDTVSGTFFTNSGTGNFTAGPVVP